MTREKINLFIYLKNTIVEERKTRDELMEKEVNYEINIKTHTRKLRKV